MWFRMHMSKKKGDGDLDRNALVEKIAENAGLSKKDSKAALDTALSAIVDAVASGEKVALIGFGTFEARSRAARQGRNPQNGVTVEIPASTIPAFKPGKAFKDTVNK